MAHSAKIHCIQCKKDVELMVLDGCTEPDICYDCKSKNKKKVKDEYLESLAKLSVEERLGRIEELIYEINHA